MRLTSRDRLLVFFLWWAVLGMSLWVGGTVFSMLVVVPLWAHAPPDSVRSFFGETPFNTTVWRFFGPPWMAARLLPIFVSFVLAWHRPRLRNLLAVTVASMTFGVAFTVLYVYDINQVLMTQAGGSLSAAEISSLVRQWVFADRLRFAVGLVGYIALLKAFRQSSLSQTVA